MSYQQHLLLKTILPHHANTIAEIVVGENALRIVCLVVKVLVMAIAVELVKEIVKVIAWELAKLHAKAVAKTHAVEAVPILALVVLKYN